MPDAAAPTIGTLGDGDVSGLRRRLYALAAVDEFAPLFALFTLWFADNDVTTAQISLAFIVWSVVALALEIPSGAVADRVDRRLLVAAAFVLRAVGIGIWLVWPTPTGLVVGALLWAVHDAAASGAWEALIHDELTAVGRADEYGVVIARVGQMSHGGLALGTLAASGLVALGVSISAVGWVNVAVHAVSVVLVLSLPDVRWVARDVPADEQPTDAGAPGGPGAVAAWWSTLRQGVRDIGADGTLARLAVVGAALGGLFIVDEYVPLLARARDADDAIVPLLVLAVWLGLLAGGEVAARRPDLRAATLASAIVGGAAVMAFAISFDTPWALVAVGVGYGTIEATWVVADARFQALAPTATRATVTSVRSLGAGLVSVAAFAVIALRTRDEDPTPGLHWVIGVLALCGYLVWRWIPRRAAVT